MYRNGYVLVAIVLLLAAACPAQTSAQARSDATAESRPDAVDEFESDEAAYEKAFRVMYEDPGNLDKAFAYARLASRVRDFEGAISTLERMLLLDPNLPRVRMELGVLYFRLGSFQVAKGYFEEVLSDETAPDIVKRRVQAFLDEIEQQTSAHRWSATVFAGIRHQSNANAGPSTTRIRVLGLDADLDSRFTDQSDLDTFATVRLTHGYDFGIEPKVELESDLTLYGANQATQDQLDSSVVQLKTGPRFIVDPDIARNVDVRPYLRWDNVGLADRQYYLALGGGVNANWRYDERTRFSGDASLVERSYNNKASSSTLTILNGPRAAFSLSATHAYSPTLQFRASSNIGREAASDSGRRNWSYQASLTGTRVFDSPFPEHTGPWSLAATGSVSTTLYDDPNPTIDPSVTREDDSWSAQLVGTVALTPKISLVANGIYKKVKSNLPNFKHDNWSFSLGAAVQF